MPARNPPKPKRHPYIRTARDVGFLQLCRDFYTRPSGARSGIVGGLFTLFGALALWKLATSAGLVAIFLVVLAIALAVGMTPLYEAARARAALERGRFTRARVNALETISSGRITLDALTNGWAEGTRLVDLDDSQFEDAFATDAPWAPDLRPGSVTWVVIDDRQRRVLLDAGLAEG
jgi:multisubunit Na+/H+ antiporter MnhG subunit